MSGPLFKLFGKDCHQWPWIMIITTGGKEYAFTRKLGIEFHITEDDILVVSDNGVITSAHKISSVWPEFGKIERYEV